MPICVGMGEGAGAVAAMAVLRHVAYDKVDIKEIQRYLTTGEPFKR